MRPELLELVPSRLKEAESALPGWWEARDSWQRPERD